MEKNRYVTIVVKQEDLSRVLSNLVGVSTRKSTIAYLSQVRIFLSGGAAEFTTTDNELSLTDTVVDIANVDDVAISVDVFKLHEIVRHLPIDAEVRLSIDQVNLAISSGKIEFALPYLDAATFPSISEEEKQGEIEFSKDEIKTLFNKVKFAISTESTRQHLNGIYLESDGEKITAAATDIHRLAVATLDKKTGFNFSCIVPKKTVLEMIKLSTMGKVLLSLHGREYTNRVKVVVGNVYLNSKLVAGTFPDFTAVIPKTFKFSLSMNKKAIARAVERIGLVSPDQSRAIRLTIREKTLSVEASNSDASFGREALELDSEFDGDMSIHFNHAYLLDIFSVLESEEMVMCFNNPTSQVLFKDGSDESVLYIIMPMSI
ncbi:DNA polymerase III, beta subunit [Neorickettsia helminthoeca str. Oregon]|uniref:Beta sliding clamp n=1 Tax=Neorickettsia helminthoeca str. Oregon TaxID=1286528 RepID=X5HL76_9RICK|nr:DNA polymerase III subunit beta [Neorickettsia helminthoeca]AHX11120.1 DNA polymerase III, beta subunit [Neorickettsia helminthoeca str. Oregon]